MLMMVSPWYQAASTCHVTAEELSEPGSAIEPGGNILADSDCCTNRTPRLRVASSKLDGMIYVRRGLDVVIHMQPVQSGKVTGRPSIGQHRSA